MEASNPLKGSSRLNLKATRLPGEVVMIALCERKVFTAFTVSDTLWDQEVITDESFEDLGPAIQDMVLHAEARSTSGVFEFRVALQRKNHDGEWGPLPGSIGVGDLLLGGTTADGYAPLSVFTDRTRMGGAKIRIIVQYHAKSTGGGVVGAKSEISLSVALRFFAS